MDSQVKEVELRIKKKAKEEIDAERKSLRDIMKDEMDELQAHLSMFEKVRHCWVWANTQTLMFYPSRWMPGWKPTRQTNKTRSLMSSVPSWRKRSKRTVRCDIRSWILRPRLLWCEVTWLSCAISMRISVASYPKNANALWMSFTSRSIFHVSCTSSSKCTQIVLELSLFEIICLSEESEREGEGGCWCLICLLDYSMLSFASISLDRDANRRLQDTNDSMKVVIEPDRPENFVSLSFKRFPPNRVENIIEMSS